MHPPVGQEHLDVIRIPLGESHDRIDHLRDVGGRVLGIGREIAQQAQGVRLIERLERERRAPGQSALLSAPLTSPPRAPARVSADTSVPANARVTRNSTSWLAGSTNWRSSNASNTGPSSATASTMWTTASATRRRIESV